MLRVSAMLSSTDRRFRKEHLQPAGAFAKRMRSVRACRPAGSLW